MSALEIYDVIVIGAGPVGLATAIGLRQRGIENILVIDRTRAFRQVGQIIDILPNGLKALKSIDLVAYESLKQETVTLASPSAKTNNDEETTIATQEQKSRKPSRQWMQVNLQGQTIRAISLEYDDWLKEYGEGRLSTTWYNLQTSLRQMLPSEQVRANHCCIDLIEDSASGCVRVDCVSDLGTEINPYGHWIDSSERNELSLAPTSQQLSKHFFLGKLVVAADGINSQVRRIIYRDSDYEVFAEPEYSGFAAIGCLGGIKVSDKLLAELENKFLKNSSILTIFNDRVTKDSGDGKKSRMMLIHRTNGELGYLLHLALPLAMLKEAKGSKLIDLAVQQLGQADFPDSLKQVVLQSILDNLISRPYYIHRASLNDAIQFPSTARLHRQDDNFSIQPPWSKGRVVLVGDAAHGMPPFRAQGANQGLEDALAICVALARIKHQQAWNNTSAIERIFQAYEQLRRPLIAQVQKATLDQLDRSEQEQIEYEQRVYYRNIDREVAEAFW